MSEKNRNTGIGPGDAVHLRMKNKKPFIWKETYQRNKTGILNTEEYQKPDFRLKL